MVLQERTSSTSSKRKMQNVDPAAFAIVTLYGAGIHLLSCSTLRLTLMSASSCVHATLVVAAAVPVVVTQQYCYIRAAVAVVKSIHTTRQCSDSTTIQRSTAAYMSVLQLQDSHYWHTLALRVVSYVIKLVI
jgi:hypothetical protein